ncbi:MAG: hypothetical protein JJ863_08410 [Deltaproteobacteria bacterium]|nr:hypothetical protein [Deltaproteobacteria bacterium]
MRTELEGRAFRGLARTFWLLDLRGQHYGRATGAKAGDLLPPLFWVVGQFLTVSLLATLVLIGRVDLYFFCAAHLGLAALLTFSALVVELDEAIFHPADRLALAGRPVPLRTYALARFLNLLRYVGLLSLALLPFPLVVGASLPEAGLAFVPGFVVAFAITQVGITALVVLLRALVQRKGADGLRGALAWVQILAILGLFYGGQAMVRQGSTAITELAASRPAWLTFTPPGWLAAQLEASDLSAFARLGGALAAVALLGWIAAVRLARAYAHVREGGHLFAVRELPATSGALGAASGNRPARAGRWLTGTLLSRDQDVKARIWPQLALPGAVLAMAFVVGRAGDPWQHVDGLELTLAFPVVLIAVIPHLVLALRYGRDPEASALLELARLQHPAAFDAGVRRALFLRVLAPVLIASAVAYGIAWRDPLHALAHTTLLAALALATLSVAQRSLLREVPFRRSPQRGLVHGSAVLVSGSMGALASALMVGYWRLAGDPEALAIGLGAVVSVALLVSWIGGRR